MQMLAIVFALGVTLVQSLPAGPVPGGPESVAPIVKQDLQTSFDGSFKNSYETGNGIAVDQSGYVKSNGADSIQVIQGASAYTSPEGVPIQLQYIADENGYQPQGAHLPTPPPADPVILKALEYLASLPSTPEPVPAVKYYKPKSYSA